MVYAFITVLLIGGGCYLVLFAITSSMFPSETTDVSEYTTILSQWQQSGLINHFPPAIPACASDVRLSFFPGFLQGGAHFQIRMKVPPSELKVIETQFRQLTSHQYKGGSFFDHYNDDQQNNLPTTSFHTADDPSQTYAFPEHYTLYVIHAKDRGGNWNHGETCGVAVSIRIGEVIYWAESW